MGKVIGIATREKTRAIMDTCHAAQFTFDKGVADDSRGKKKNNRQVTVLTQEGWFEACSDLGTSHEWTIRRANLFVQGLDLTESMGSYLKSGDLILEITGELVPCERMDEQVDGLTNALKPNWRGGVTCKVIAEGAIEEESIITLTNTL